MFSRPTRMAAAQALLMAAAAIVFLRPLSAQIGDPFGPGAAKVIAMTGRVSVLKDGVEWARSVGDVVQPKQIIVTGPDGYAKFQLADGSTFEVFQNTRAVFHDTPGWEEMLNVLIGRVKVYVEHKNGPNHKRVTTQTAVISVRGTVFDVVVEDVDATTFISVEEGVVDVRHLRYGGNEIELHPGESIRVYRDQPLAKVADKTDAMHAALRAAAQAIYDILYNRGINSGGTAGAPPGGTTGSQGDSGRNPSGGKVPPPSAP